MRPSREFGAVEAEVYRKLVQPEAPKILTLTDAMEGLGKAKANSFSHTMSSLESKGVLKRIGKGVYLNKSTGLMPKVVDLIPQVFRNTKYYLGLNAVANHWGLSSQIPYAYYVICTPRDEAQKKRIASWCSMLKRLEKDLGGTIVPVVAHTLATIDKGITQSIIDGSQLLISTIERTIIDAVMFTEEIGGPGEALLWTRRAMAKSIDYNELEKISSSISVRINSVAPRLGFLLETMLTDIGQIPVEGRISADRLVRKLQSIASKTRATYNWGSENASAEYFPKWHLHISMAYLNQLKELRSFE